MIAYILLAVGLVLAIEGLVLALAPSRLEELLEAFISLPVEARRKIGLVACAFGALLVWSARNIGI